MIHQLNFFKTTASLRILQKNKQSQPFDYVYKNIRFRIIYCRKSSKFFQIQYLIDLGAKKHSFVAAIEQ